MNQQAHQQAFDIAVRRILKQGRSSAGGGGCRYRSGDQCVCAVGALFPDDRYRPDFDTGTTLGEVYANVPELQQYNITFLREMQMVHDRAHSHSLALMPDARPKAFIKMFRERAKLFAAQYELDTSVLKEKVPS